MLFRFPKAVVLALSVTFGLSSCFDKDRAAKVHANLLVVFLFVDLYKAGGARSSEILCPARGENLQTAESPRFQPRGHDLVRLLRETLATD